MQAGAQANCRPHEPGRRSLHPVFLTAGAVRIRASLFDAPHPRGICLLLNGQSEYIEKYFEVIDELRGRGFSVVTFDWRGQGGSQRLLPNPRKAHIPDFADYDRDLDTVMREMVRPLAMETALPVIAMAHSMGDTFSSGGCMTYRMNFVASFFAPP